MKRIYAVLLAAGIAALASPALADPSVRERYAQGGLEPVGGTPEQFARQYRDDFDKYARLIRELNIRLE